MGGVQQLALEALLGTKQQTSAPQIHLYNLALDLYQIRGMIYHLQATAVCLSVSVSTDLPSLTLTLGY
jgi:hypothetical protein